MSYILDALRKSDQQRQRGATPTLMAAQVTTAGQKRSRPYVSGMLAAALICAGILIGWLQPWQAARRAPGPAPGAAAPLYAGTASAAPSQAPLPAVTEEAAHGVAPGRSLAPLPATDIPARQPSPQSSGPGQRATPRDTVAAAPIDAAIAGPGEAAPAGPAAPAPDKGVMAQADLPAAILREIPEVAIALHVYSSAPKERRIMANGEMLREGDALGPGLRLEQITPDGVILGYKGLRFHRGVR